MIAREIRVNADSADCEMTSWCLLLVFGIPASGKTLLAHSILQQLSQGTSKVYPEWIWLAIHFDDFYPTDTRSKKVTHVLIPSSISQTFYCLGRYCWRAVRPEGSTAQSPAFSGSASFTQHREWRCNRVLICRCWATLRVHHIFAVLEFSAAHIQRCWKVLANTVETSCCLGGG